MVWGDYGAITGVRALLGQVAGGRQRGSGLDVAGGVAGRLPKPSVC